MRRAVASLGRVTEPDHLLVDARTVPGVDLPQTSIVRGDSKDASIAAASIVAKVHRDAHHARPRHTLPGLRLRAAHGLRHRGAPRGARAARRCTVARSHPSPPCVRAGARRAAQDLATLPRAIRPGVRCSPRRPEDFRVDELPLYRADGRGQAHLPASSRSAGARPRRSRACSRARAAWRARRGLRGPQGSRRHHAAVVLGARASIPSARARSSSSGWRACSKPCAIATRSAPVICARIASRSCVAIDAGDLEGPANRRAPPEMRDRGACPIASGSSASVATGTTPSEGARSCCGGSPRAPRDRARRASWCRRCRPRSSTRCSRRAPTARRGRARDRRARRRSGRTRSGSTMSTRETARAADFEISATGPIFGTKMRAPRAAARSSSRRPIYARSASPAAAAGRTLRAPRGIRGAGDAARSSCAEARGLLELDSRRGPGATESRLRGPARCRREAYATVLLDRARRRGRSDARSTPSS